jgi:hypothetical protein
MSNRHNWKSALKALLGSADQDCSRVEPVDPAPVASGGTSHMCAGVSREGPDLLLMRMEALRLEPSDVKAFMPSEFRVLARVCDHCQDKIKCERDLMYEAAGKAVSWERYCPNASRLRAIGSAGRG